MINISKISTENNNNNTKKIDSLPTKAQVSLILQEFQSIDKALIENVNSIAVLVDMAFDTLTKKGKVYYIGAGTSGRLGILDASEILPTYGEGNMFKGIIAGGEKAIISPVENAEDDLDQAIKDVKKANISKRDLLIGISASGRTPYVMAALQYAKSIGIKTGSISNSKNSEISPIVDAPIEIVVGSEPIVGSTRMKSGSAQKIVLNTISSLAMVKIGKTYGNLMVDVLATNKKLKTRSLNIIVEVTGVSVNEAEKALKKAGDSVKLAIVMIYNNQSKKDSLILLKNNKGKLKNIIKE